MSDNPTALLDLSTLLDEKSVLVADGGMGTSLFAMGLASGETPERWNVDYPDRVAAVHQSFVDVGSDIILTNTFGGTRARLDLDKLGDRVAELNKAGVAVARSVADAAVRPVLVAGSVGPTGSLFQPLGPLTIEDGVELFNEQMDALVAAGADILWIETLSSIEELTAAVTAASGRGLPIVTTMSFDTNGKTMMGVPPADLARWWQDAAGNAAAIGANCGVGPSDVVIAVSEIHAADAEAVVVAKGNCGIPEIVDGKLWYPTSSDSMTDYAQLALDSGARIIGACCGSVPEHLAEIRKVADNYERGPVPSIADVEARLGAVARPAEVSSESPRRRRRRG